MITNSSVSSDIHLYKRDCLEFFIIDLTIDYEISIKCQWIKNFKDVAPWNRNSYSSKVVSSSFWYLLLVGFIMCSTIDVYSGYLVLPAKNVIMRKSLRNVCGVFLNRISTTNMFPNIFRLYQQLLVLRLIEVQEQNELIRLNDYNTFHKSPFFSTMKTITL